LVETRNGGTSIIIIMEEKVHYPVEDSIIEEISRGFVSAQRLEAACVCVLPADV
jgi:hypothetical protein